MKIDFFELEKMDYETGGTFLLENGYCQLALQRDPLTEAHWHQYALFDESDPENDDPDIIHKVSFLFYRKQESNESDKMELWHWVEDNLE